MILRLLVMCLCLGACSNASHYEGQNQSLEFRILDNGSKQFVYRTTRRAYGETPRPETGMPRVRSPIPDERDYRRLQNRTANVVAEVGYCREGYLELDFRLAMNVQWIRGECRESASSSDREHFGRQGEIPL